MLDLRVVSAEHIHERYVLLKLGCDQELPVMVPGQFVEVRIDGDGSTFLRRPISINFVDRSANELWLLVAVVGNGTRWLASLKSGDCVNCVLPLGNGFSLPKSSDTVEGSDTLLADSELQRKFLLVGGGVGVAPLLFLGAALRTMGVNATFLLGARTGGDLLMLNEFEKYGRVMLTTEDGSEGERGFVTQHSILTREQFDTIYTCGPTPMMKAVASFALKNNVECEASLENMMACGLGACLCCVEKTTEGNLCVCKDGPVFNVRRLLWQNA